MENLIENKLILKTSSEELKEENLTYLFVDAVAQDLLQAQNIVHNILLAHKCIIVKTYN